MLQERIAYRLGFKPDRDCQDAAILPGGTHSELGNADFLIEFDDHGHVHAVIDVVAESGSERPRLFRRLVRRLGRPK